MVLVRLLQIGAKDLTVIGHVRFGEEGPSVLTGTVYQPLENNVSMPVNIHATSLSRNRNPAKNQLTLERLIARYTHPLEMDRLIGRSAYLILEGQICLLLY